MLLVRTTTTHTHPTPPHLNSHMAKCTCRGGGHQYGPPICHHDPTHLQALGGWPTVTTSVLYIREGPTALYHIKCVEVDDHGSAHCQNVVDMPGDLTENRPNCQQALCMHPNSSLMAATKPDNPSTWIWGSQVFKPSQFLNYINRGVQKLPISHNPFSSGKTLL